MALRARLVGGRPSAFWSAVGEVLPRTVPVWFDLEGFCREAVVVVDVDGLSSGMGAETG